MSFSSEVKSLAIASMKTHNDDPHISANGTSLCGYLEDVRYQALEDAFGPPVDTEGLDPTDQTDAEWTIWFKFQFGDGEHALDDLDDDDDDDDNWQTAVARIYNWKDGINSRGTEHGTPYRQIREWHVGGDNEQVVELVRAVLS